MIHGYQLSAICGKLDIKIKPYFRGLFNPDTTEDALAMIDSNKPNFLIFNTDFSHRNGSHWVAAYVDLEKESYFIDSFAHNPNFYSLEKFWSAATDNDFKMLPNQLQSKYTTVCGLYCLFFGHYLCQNKDMVTVLSMIQEKTNILRDQHIFEWFQNHFGDAIKLENPVIDCNKFKGAEKQKCDQYHKMILARQSM